MSETPCIINLKTTTILTMACRAVQNPNTGVSPKCYFAFNVIGVVCAADCELSEYDIIMEGDENIPPLRH